MENIIGIEINKESLIIEGTIGVILFSEFPSTVLCIDNNEELYVKEWVDCSDDGKTDRYFYYKTNKKDIALFLSNQISHLDLINKCEDGFVYFQDKTGNLNSNYTIIGVNKITPSYLPDFKFKLDKSDIVDYDSIDKFLNLKNIDTSTDISVSVKNLSIKNSNPIISLYFKKGESVGYGTIKTEVLANTLMNFEKLYESVTLDIQKGTNRGEVKKSKKEDLQDENIINLGKTKVVGQIAASFGLFLTPFSNQTNFFDEEPFGDKIAKKTFELFNNSIDTDKLKLECEMHSEFTILAYYNLLNTIYKSDINLDFIWYSHKAERYLNQVINSNLANKIKQDITNLKSSNEPDPFNSKGKFRAIDCDRKTFAFIDLDDTHLKGKFDRQITKGDLEQISFTNLYNIKLQRKITKDMTKGFIVKETIISFEKDE